jgi:hypothetical protein
MSRAVRGAVLGALLLLSTTGCENTGSHPILEIESTAVALGVLFLDLNGSGGLELAADQPVAGWQVRLIGANRAVVATTTTDSLGIFVFDDLPTGRVTLDVDRARLGDTLQIFGLTGREVSLARDDTARMSVGITYPKVSVAAVDSLPLGRRVFVEGIALNPVTLTGPRELHLRSGARALRLVNIVRKPLNPGDSVRVLGRRATELGRAVLTTGEITVVRAAVADPDPYEVTTRNAALANNGALTNDLVRVRNADLVRSRNELSDVILTADDGTGQVEIILRSFLGADASLFNADSVRVREATGVLVPYVTDAGEVRWRVATRTVGDLRMEPQPKTAAPKGSASTYTRSAPPRDHGARPFRPAGRR